MSAPSTVLEKDRATMSDALARMAGKGDRVRQWSTNRVLVDLHAREVYSYGRHFPLFRFVARGRKRPLVILNGDRWPQGGFSSRTNEHQAAARELAAAMGAETCVIPFSALDGAGIDRDSIRPVHVREDANWTETRYADTLAQVPSFRRTIGDYETRYADALEDVPANHRRHWSSGTYKDIERGEDGRYSWREWVTRDRAPDADGRYSWTVHVHRLGDCLFSAVRAGRRRALYLSSFDTNESPPLYFLAQVPRGAGAVTVETALDALAPRAVHAAIARGIPVERQGDVFFIRTGLTLEQLEQRGISSRARLTQWTRDANARKGETGYRRETAADKRKRLARFYAYRRAEYRRIHAEFVASTRARYLDNPPRQVRGASRTGRRDRAAMVARPLRVWNGADNAYLTDGNRARAAFERAHNAALARYGAAELRPHDYREKVRRAVSIYGTAHSAREVIRTRSGAVYVTGTVRHVPGIERGRGGAPDHRPLELGDGYWLAVRNTVPRADTRRRA